MSIWVKTDRCPSRFGPPSPWIWTPQSLHRGTSLALRKPGICMRGVELPQNEVELKTCSLFVAPRSFLTHPRRATWKEIG